MPVITVKDGVLPTEGLSAYEVYQLYNCLDSAVTAQLVAPMKAELNQYTKLTYERELRVQQLCLEMSVKGFPVGKMPMAEMLWKLEKQATKSLKYFHKFCAAVGAPAINPSSPLQLSELFYNYLGLPTQYEWDRKTNKRKVATDIGAMETLKANYPVAAPFVNAIMAHKEAKKMASVFKRGLEPQTGNLRCNFSPSGTETGRLSSQQNPYQRGTNAQNLTDYVRHVIEAPEGYAIVNFDLKTAESIAVGYISSCRSYIDACLTGDLHTRVATMNWPHLPWTQDLKQDKAIAEKPYYRHFSYRDMAKRGGHATNYYSKAASMAKNLGILPKIGQEFQDAYFKAFPELQMWHLDVIAQIQTTGIITTRLGRQRRFWGRPDDATTHRKAIAYNPQSLVADAWNEGLVTALAWIVAHAKDIRLPNGKRVSPYDLRAQVHDAGVFLIPIDGLDQYIEELQPKLIYPVDFGNLGVMRIPTDTSVGKRWCKAPKKPSGTLLDEGLKDYNLGQGLHW